MCAFIDLLLHRMLWQKADNKHLNILLVFFNPTLTPVYTNMGVLGECGIYIIRL